MPPNSQGLMERGWGEAISPVSSKGLADEP